MKTNSLCKLNVSIDDLYNNKFQINIHFDESKHIYHLILNSFGVIDCKLSCFSANVWTRTKAGTEKKKYKTLKSLQTEIKKHIRKNLNINGLVFFSLSKNINLI